MVVIFRIMISKISLYFLRTPAYVSLVARDICRCRVEDLGMGRCYGLDLKHPPSLLLKARPLAYASLRGERAFGE